MTNEQRMIVSALRAQGMGYGAGLRLPLLSLSTAYQAEADRLVAAALALEEHSSHDTIAA